MRLKMLADAQSGAEKTKMVPTDFAMNAKELDQVVRVVVAPERAIGQRFAFVGASGGHFAGVVSMERLRRVGMEQAGGVARRRLRCAQAH